VITEFYSRIQILVQCWLLSITENKKEVNVGTRGESIVTTIPLIDENDTNKVISRSAYDQLISLELMH